LHFPTGNRAANLLIVQYGENAAFLAELRVSELLVGRDIGASMLRRMILEVIEKLTPYRRVREKRRLSRIKRGLFPKTRRDETQVFASQLHWEVGHPRLSICRPDLAYR
jgi:hypothetical protein